MRVALLYPEVYDMARFHERRKEFPPFGVLYLAAVLRDAGHDPIITKVVKGEPPLDLRGFDAIGVSIASSATYGLLLDARRRALIDPTTLVMVGGVHANFYPADTLRDFCADVVSVGEGEQTILRLLEHNRDRDFRTVPGAYWASSDGSVRHNPAPAASRDISDLPLPARDLLPPEDFVMSDRLAGRDLRMAHVMLSRGCPFPCSFCAAGQTRIQYRDGQSARRELEDLIERYQIEGFAIVDDNFIINKTKVRDIAESIADLNLRWSALSRVDTVDPDLLHDIAKSGCIEIKFGVESGSESLLKAMRKNTTREKIRSAITWAADAGIEPKAFIIHGYPGENWQTTHETMELLESLRGILARVSLFRFVPLPGTQVYDVPMGPPPIHGTHLTADWDGDWEKFHIHHNDRHWWGSGADFAEVQESYAALEDFVEQRWNVQT